MNPEDQKSMQNFASYLLSLPPNEYTTLAFVIGLLLSQGLNSNQNNSLGNWLMELSQVMITISAQQQNLSSNNSTNNN